MSILYSHSNFAFMILIQKDTHEQKAVLVVFLLSYMECTFHCGDLGEEKESSPAVDPKSNPFFPENCFIHVPKAIRVPHIQMMYRKNQQYVIARKN